MSNDSEVPSKEEIIKNMAKHLQTHPEDGEEVLLRTYELAFIKGTIEDNQKINLILMVHLMINCKI